MATTVGKQKKVFFPSPLIRAGDSRGMQRHKGKVWQLQGHKKTQPSYRFWSETEYLFGEFLRQLGWQDFIYYILSFCFFKHPGQWHQSTT